MCRKPWPGSKINIGGHTSFMQILPKENNAVRHGMYCTKLAAEVEEYKASIKTAEKCLSTMISEAS